MSCVIPALLIGFVFFSAESTAGGEETVPTLPQTAQTEPTLPTFPTVTAPQPLPPQQMWISVLDDGEYQTMELEEYIFHVVLGEMPATFEKEALKAQAVVARTYSLKICAEGKRHDGAVCTDAGCCQTFKQTEEYLSGGGTEELLQKVRQAVDETSGQVLTYGGELITATYFSCSGGSTEDAVAVWGYDVPYLQSVESPGEEDASAYYREKTFTPKEFCKAMALRLTGDPKSWFGRITYTEGGGVATIEIGGVSYRGTTIRSLLKLRSTMFSVEIEDGNIIFSTKGYGHRVGMSQYGADAMAAAGASFAEILQHYYSGAILEEFPLTQA